MKYIEIVVRRGEIEYVITPDIGDGKVTEIRINPDLATRIRYLQTEQS